MEIWTLTCCSFRLAQNKAASDEMAWHCKHRTGRGVLKLYESGAALAEDMEVLASNMEKTVEATIRLLSNRTRIPMEEFSRTPERHVVGRSLWEDGFWEEC